MGTTGCQGCQPIRHREEAATQKGYRARHDTWKAALPMRHGLTLVTGNVRHFQYFPVQIFNPF